MCLVLIISFLNAGGAERVLTDLANCGVSKGYYVTLITLALPDAKPFFILLIQRSLCQSIFYTDRKYLKARVLFKKGAPSLSPTAVLFLVNVECIDPFCNGCVANTCDYVKAYVSFLPYASLS